MSFIIQVESKQLLYDLVLLDKVGGIIGLVQLIRLSEHSFIAKTVCGFYFICTRASGWSFAPWCSKASFLKASFTAEQNAINPCLEKRLAVGIYEGMALSVSDEMKSLKAGQELVLCAACNSSIRFLVHSSQTGWN